MVSVTIPEWVAARIERLPHDFTGRVELNFFRGGIANMNLTESVKPTDK